MPRFRNISDKQPDFIRGYGFEGSAGTQMFPGSARDAPGLRRGLQEDGPRLRRRVHQHGRLRRGAARATRTRSSLDPEVKDKWGIPVLRFNYKFGDNEKKMCADMADTAQEMFEEAGFEIVDVDRDDAHRGLVDPRAGHGAHGQRTRRPRS